MSRLSPGRSEETYQAFEILEEGYLVRWAGIDPDTGEPWKPTWVPKRDCGEELITRWELNEQSTAKGLPGSGSLSINNAATGAGELVGLAFRNTVDCLCALSQA